MNNKIRNVAKYFFSGIYGIFILVTIVMFIIYKPIIDSFSESENKIFLWYFFISSIFLITLLIVLISKKIIQISQFFINNKIIMFLTIILLTLIPRLIWINLVNVVPKSDFEFYHNIAKELLSSGVKGNDYISMFPHVIGYPTVLSVFYKLFGAKVIVAQTLNILCSCGIAVLIYFIGEKLMNESCGFIASIFWTLWPSQILYNSLVATEELYTFLDLLCIFLFIRITEKKRRFGISVILFMGLGILIALLNAIRPFGILLMTAIAIYYFIFVKEQHAFIKSGAIKIVLFLILFFAYYFAAQMINLSITNALKQDIAHFPVGFNTYVGSNIKYGGVWNEEDAETLAKLMKDKNNTSQDIHDQLFKKGIERFKTQSFENIELLKEKHITMWVTDNDILWYIRTALDEERPSRIDFIESYDALNIINNFYYYVMLLLSGMSSIIDCKNKQNSHVVFLFIIISGMIATHMIVEVSGRYHYPAISMFSLIGSYGLVNCGLSLKVFKHKNKMITQNEAVLTQNVN